MSITIDDIKATQAKLAQMIAAFEQAGSSTINLPASSIELKAGELYAGILLDDNGQPLHHLILLPGDAEDLDWPAANEWAAAAGGSLPTRREQSLLFANLQQAFQRAWYWSGEQHADVASYAWCQHFSYGTQGYSRKGAEGRVRAVRRLPL